jgi:hypothetical protein
MAVPSGLQCRFRMLRTVTPPLVLVTVLIVKTVTLSCEAVAQEAAVGSQTARLPDDGWRHTKLGWQKTSSWNIHTAQEFSEESELAGLRTLTGLHPAVMAIWMLLTSLVALRLFPYRSAVNRENKHEQATENPWLRLLRGEIPRARSVKVDPSCGRSLF